MTALLTALFVLAAQNSPGPYSPCIGAPMVLWMRGPVAIPSDPAARVAYRIDIDGIAQPSPGLLSPYPPVPDADNTVPYITPGALVTLTTTGRHTITVTYGPSNTRVSVVWIGATVARSPIGLADIPCPSPTARERR